MHVQFDTFLTLSINSLTHGRVIAIYFAMGNGKSYTILLKAMKIGKKNFGELLVIHQSFLPPTFFTVWYVYNVEHSAVNTCQQVFSFS